MAIFLTIHGAWYGGWSFERLRAALEARGHGLVSPDLPGIGGDEATLAAVTLEGWADFVAGLALAQAEPVILCGHSRGGILISEAAERAPEAVKALVYASAFLVPSGRCLNDLVAWFQRATPVRLLKYIQHHTVFDTPCQVSHNSSA